MTSSSCHNQAPRHDFPRQTHLGSEGSTPPVDPDPRFRHNLPSNGYLRLLLHHPDLHSNNKLVSDDLDIVGLIVWQHASVLPLFLAAGIPNFSKLRRP
ncbi:unnamed protein product [Penicillium roqueforti FM164]|uniref:Genomic scaffold, ProqFM164S01 n=1 Tax=Penicillium roqueforti (strain FM164) TaxID=1365484 RepID=W6Q0B1_PENRF|nr:unnamed protein product [Penicillium roqueforti FM164]